MQTFPDKSTELILYCGGGYRSALAADNLQKMGYSNVFSMAGGWKAWKEAVRSRSKRRNPGQNRSGERVVETPRQVKRSCISMV